jgi:hypothetical protein
MYRITGIKVFVIRGSGRKNWKKLYQVMSAQLYDFASQNLVLIYVGRMEELILISQALNGYETKKQLLRDYMNGKSDENLQYAEKSSEINC